jgi:hypothetical protein
MARDTVNVRGKASRRSASGYAIERDGDPGADIGANAATPPAGASQTAIHGGCVGFPCFTGQDQRKDANLL